MFKYDDFYLLCHKLWSIYLQFESIEEFVNDSMKLTGKSVINTFKSTFGTINGFPDSKSKSACKRLNLLFRWMNRKDSIVDFGRWDLIENKDLIIPLDTHVINMAHELGFIDQPKESYKTAVEITEKLKSIFPEDPMKGDFALFGYSVNKNTKSKKVSEMSIQEVILTELFFENTFKTLNEFWDERENARRSAGLKKQILKSHVIDELHNNGYWEPGVFILLFTKVFNKSNVDLSRAKRDFVIAVGNGILKSTIEKLIEDEKKGNN
jgi:hypothetical protein